MVWHPPGVTNVLSPLFYTTSVFPILICAWIVFFANDEQRIALVYCVVALIETFTTKLRPTVIKPGPVSIFTAYKWQW